MLAKGRQQRAASGPQLHVVSSTSSLGAASCNRYHPAIRACCTVAHQNFENGPAAKLMGRKGTCDVTPTEDKCNKWGRGISKTEEGHGLLTPSW